MVQFECNSFENAKLDFNHKNFTEKDIKIGILL